MSLILSPPTYQIWNQPNTEKVPSGVARTALRDQIMLTNNLHTCLDGGCETNGAAEVGGGTGGDIFAK